MSALLPDRAVLRTFIETLFKRASPDTFIVFKAYDKDNKPIFKAEGCQIGDPKLVDRTYALAERTALCGRPAGFCPPVATFVNTLITERRWRARSQDVAEGLTLSVEADENPTNARELLTELLGPPTLVSASGGEWIDPATGKVQEKLHLHWRLCAAARTSEDRKKLREARKIATTLVGADPSNIPLNHPLRWSGSVHNKATPRLARIVELNDREIDLSATLDLLRVVWGNKPFRPERDDADRGDPTADLEDVASALQVIQNNEAVPWAVWKVVGMTIFAATAGHSTGLELFDRWSAKRPDKYDPEVTEAAWDEIDRSPPDRLAAQSLFWRANQANPKWDKPSNKKRYEGLFDSAPPGGAQAEQPKSDHGKNDVIPKIRLRPGVIAETVDDVEAALIARGGLYQRANQIVFIGEAPVVTHDKKEITASRILEREEYALAEDIADACCIMRFDARTKNHVLTNPPTWLVKTLQQRRGKFRLPILTAVINTPTLRRDGTLLSVPGYDKTTGLFFDPRGVTFPQIPLRPTRRDAELALADLSELLAGFPFKSEADRAVALSAVLTACIRQALPTAPLHGFSATTAGSGKSKLVDLASVISTGREAGVTAQTADEVEMEKRLGALLLEGAAAIAIDNCDAPLGGAFLCVACTQTTATIRPLGASRTVTVPTAALLTATGNNLVVAGDMTRRAIVCRLDARVERPELREFAFEPVTKAKAERVRYVTSALTILLAYQTAGSPHQAKPLGSFEGWSRMVRDALLWLGCGDPVATMEQTRQTDPRRKYLSAVISQWRLVIGHEPLTARNIVERATANPDFRDALLAVAGRSGNIDTKALGIWLSTLDGRIENGCCIEQAGIIAGVMRYHLIEAATGV